MFCNASITGSIPSIRFQFACTYIVSCEVKLWILLWYSTRNADVMQSLGSAFEMPKSDLSAFMGLVKPYEMGVFQLFHQS
jgi:hypothetical protein